jgi:hypothetical protein
VRKMPGLGARILSVILICPDIFIPIGDAGPANGRASRERQKQATARPQAAGEVSQKGMRRGRVSAVSPVG